MNNTNEFSVTPMNQMIDLVPGKTYNLSITILNPVNATEALDYKAYVAPYSVVTEDYDADVATKTAHTGMADWITIANPTGTLAPNESTELEFTITVPEDAPGGGQYAAIIVGIDNENKTHDNVVVANVLEIASVLYAKVDGKITHAGQILQNNVPFFVFDPTINVSTLIENTGNMHEIASGTITATNVFTGDTLASAELDNGVYTELVMPDTKRFISKEINELPMIGIINVQQNVYYNGEISTVQNNVIICPVWFLVLIILTIIAIITAITRAILKHRKGKKNMGGSEVA